MHKQYSCAYLTHHAIKLKFLSWNTHINIPKMIANHQIHERKAQEKDHKMSNREEHGRGELPNSTVLKSGYKTSFQNRTRSARVLEHDRAASKTQHSCFFLPSFSIPFSSFHFPLLLLISNHPFELAKPRF